MDSPLPLDWKSMKRSIVFVIFIIIVQLIWFFLRILEINKNVGYIIIAMLLPMVFNVFIMGA
jgi:hypothetical protein